MSGTVAELIAEAKERACPEANVLPMASERELQEMTADLREQGLLDAVVYDGGLILDGRNRWVACQLSGVEERAEEWDKQGSRMAYVLSKNLRRRHLECEPEGGGGGGGGTFFADELAAKEHIRKTEGTVALMPQSPEGKSRDFAAQQFDVSPRYVQEAKRIKEEAPTLFTALKTGEATMPQARALAQHPEAVARVEGGEATVRELLAEGIYLPPAQKPRPHQAVYALLKLHGYTDVPAAELGAAALEIADLTHEPRLYAVDLQQLRQTAAWLEAAADATAARMNGARLRVVD